MNITTTTSVVYPHEATVLAATFACAFVIIGVLGNLITIIALLRCPKLRGHATTAFVLSLCISDLLFCSFSMPLTASRYINKAWTLGDTLCQIFPVIFYGNVAVSLLSMVGITLNRYILIAYNYLYARIYHPLSISFQLIFVWAIAFFMMLPPLLGIWGQLGLHEETFSCTILKKDNVSIKKFLFFVGFGLPCIVIIVSYSCIYCTVKRQRNRLLAHVTATAASCKTSNSAREREDTRLTVMMVLIFVCFVISFLPLMIVNVFDDEVNSPWMHIFASIMAWASSVINPFIYAASNRSYRVAYYKLFATLKFWGEPLTPITSRSYAASKGGSRNCSGEQSLNGNGNKTKNGNLAKL